ncbi:MAG: hypothetical protein WA964_11715, partial [Ilumatobacter sp.]|uniref:hypothetical protein n=1 Tax=Ilumatobacter sp. TaxID=1967498 RepID=UPI003C73EB2C
ELGRLLGRIAHQNTVDQTVVDALLDRIDETTNPLKKLGALLAERLGRLKLNGQLRGYSPLSRVVELEALLASTAVRRSMWNTVVALGIDDDTTSDAALRARAADDQHAGLDEFHVDATLAAFKVSS